MIDDIDVVIPWLNPTEKWFSQYKEYCENESPCRIRDMNTIRPAIKSILKNLPWVRYIWLVVFDKEQIPNDWDELHNAKVKFVFHRDIIPEEFLPNFNSMISEMFIHKIEGLAENILFSNDDMIFTKPIPKSFYFKDGKPVHRKRDFYVYRNGHECLYSEILDTTTNFISSITGHKYFSRDYHSPIPVTKVMLEFLWFKYYDFLYSSCKDSKIRRKHNVAIMSICHTLDEVFNKCVYDDDKEIKLHPMDLQNNTSKEFLRSVFKNNHVICLNDNEHLNNEKIKDYIKEVSDEYL